MVKIFNFFEDLRINEEAVRAKNGVGNKADSDWMNQILIKNPR